MKRLHFAVALFAALVCSGLNAQTILRANIPFDFQMSNSLMPAGEYVIDCSERLLVVRAANGKHVALALTTPVSRRTVPTTGLLEFKRYGDAYFFAGVWTPYSRDGGALPASPREKELASRTVPSQMATIALSSR